MLAVEYLCQGTLAKETKWPYIRVLQCAMRGCLVRAAAMRPDAIFFLLHCGARLPNFGLVLVGFSPSCNPGAIRLNRVGI